MLDAITLLLLALVLSLVIFIIWFLGGIISFLSGGPFVPSKKDSVAIMVNLANLKAGERVVDLGSGDGRLVFAAAEKGVNATGYEVSWPAWAWSRLLQILGRHGGELRRANAFKVSLKEADVVFCYLFPDTMLKLKPKLEQELPEGARVISNRFTVPGWPVSQQQGQIFLQHRPKF